VHAASIAVGREKQAKIAIDARPIFRGGIFLPVLT
jgi:hypothetical protein